MLTIFKIEIYFSRCKDEKLEIGNLCMTTLTLIEDRQYYQPSSTIEKREGLRYFWKPYD